MVDLELRLAGVAHVPRLLRFGFCGKTHKSPAAASPSVQ